MSFKPAPKYSVQTLVCCTEVCGCVHSMLEANVLRQECELVLVLT